MDTRTVKTIREWMKGTDLAEVAYRKNGDGFALVAAGADDGASSTFPSLPAARFAPVISDTVGIFQWNVPGKARSIEEGSVIASGDVVGVIVSGSGESQPVRCAQGGRVSKIFISAGEVVEYGQPLLLLEAR